MWRFGLRLFLFSVLFLSISGIHSISARPYDWREVQQLARQIDDLARYVRREAERAVGYGDWWERRAVQDLRILEQRANRFRQQVEWWWQDPRQSRQDYERLVEAYRGAKYSFDPVYSLRHLRRDFQRLGSLVGELRRYYDGRDPHDPWDPHDPYDPH